MNTVYIIVLENHSHTHNVPSVLRIRLTLHIVHVCMYVNYLLDATDAHQIINKKQSQNDIQYKAAKPKPISLYKQLIKKDFL